MKLVIDTSSFKVVDILTEIWIDSLRISSQKEALPSHPA